ncbi:MAG TPA: hypothetical protein VFR76_14380 [Verrucomicrobiae bacterium]|nr:hypothetical protein [Verrucomicrobiae bacterium]
MADGFSQARLAFATDSGEKKTMSFTGTVKDGVVVRPPGVKLPEGMEVQLTVPDSASPEEAFVLRETASPFPTVGGLPDDLAINHDYYLHGHHKQQPRRGRWIRTDKPTPELTQQEAADCTEKLLALAAETENLPADLSANHDHYLHGMPKR